MPQRRSARMEAEKQTSSAQLFAHLKSTAKPPQSMNKIGSIETASRRGSPLSSTYQVAYIAHVPLEPRAALAHGPATTDGLHRNAAALRRAVANCRRRFTFRRPNPRHRAGHGIRLRGQAHGEGRDRSRADRESRRQTVKLVWSAKKNSPGLRRARGVIEIFKRSL